MAIGVSVIGATGYSGGELCALLYRHPAVTLLGVFGGGSGKEARFGSLHPSLRKVSGPDVAPFSVDALLAGRPEVAFLAVPHEVAAEVTPTLLEAGIRVIDLSAAYRLGSASDYPTWYGFTHPSPALLAEAVYGLTEWSRDRLAGARLVANPGCYPTSVLLATKPLAALLDPAQPVIADCKSGVSGAGKKTELGFSFSELAGSFKAYGIGTHRHEVEMRQGLGHEVLFTPHLLPLVRGILSTVHVAFARTVEPAELATTYDAVYASEPFVRVLPAGETPELKDVVGTPRCDIGFVVLAGGRRAVLVSVLDNLLKGAASQAVQNLNAVLGLPASEGLS